MESPNTSLPYSAPGHLHRGVVSKVCAFEQHAVEDVVICLYDCFADLCDLQIFPSHFIDPATRRRISGDTNSMTVGKRRWCVRARLGVRSVPRVGAASPPHFASASFRNFRRHVFTPSPSNRITRDAAKLYDTGFMPMVPLVVFQKASKRLW
jgi:hypothetical protein